MNKLCVLAFVLLALVMPALAQGQNDCTIDETFISQMEATFPLNGDAHATRAGFGEGIMTMASNEVCFTWFAGTNSDGNLEFVFDTKASQLDRYVGIFARNTDGQGEPWNAWIDNGLIIVGTGNCWLWEDCRPKANAKPMPLHKALESAVGQFKKLPLIKDMKILHYYR